MGQPLSQSDNSRVSGGVCYVISFLLLVLLLFSCSSALYPDEGSGKSGKSRKSRPEQVPNPTVGMCVFFFFNFWGGGEGCVLISFIPCGKFRSSYLGKLLKMLNHRLPPTNTCTCKNMYAYTHMHLYIYIYIHLCMIRT